jgi:hypothetical protein
MLKVINTRLLILIAVMSKACMPIKITYASKLLSFIIIYIIQI